MTEKEWEAAGLYDPGDPAARDRGALLQYLADRGATLAQMIHARDQGRLAGLGSDLLLQGLDAPDLTLAEFAELAQMEPALVSAIWRAAGFPDPDPGTPLFYRAMLPTFEVFRIGEALLGREVALQFARVLGSALARVADTAVGAFQLNVEEPLVRRNEGELALAQANVGAVEALMTIPQVMEGLFRSHVEAAIRRGMQARPSPGEYHDLNLAVGFVDVVGFTRLAQQLDTRALGAAISDFERDAFEITATHDTRLVKLIGDEAMFVTADVSTACDVALALCAAVERHPILPAARGALAHGPLVRREGDYYGPLVNLASRAVKLADPGQVLVTDVVTQHADARRFDFRSVGLQTLRDVEKPVELYALAPAQ